MRLIVVILVALSMVGCLKDHGLTRNPYPEIQPVTYPAPRADVARAPGSLYSDAYSRGNMITDARAYRPNDIVLVAISESTTATNTATTALERTHDDSFQIPSLFGANLSSITGAATDGTALGVSSEKEHEGSGSTARTGIFTGSLAARVIDVLPNDYLVIQGYKDIQVNGEKQRMYLSGIVNPLMISKDHTIASSQIADLQLRYGGEGVVNAQQNPGWLSRVLGFIWPF